MNEPEKLIPHRPPFLFLDRLTAPKGGAIVGYRLFRKDEFFFAGHFPEYPVVPGVLLVESMAQCGGAGALLQGLLPPNTIFFLASVYNAKFRSRVHPGDEIKMTVDNLRSSRKMIRQRGVACVGDTTAVEAEWLCILGEPE